MQKEHGISSEIHPKHYTEINVQFIEKSSFQKKVNARNTLFTQ